MSGKQECPSVLYGIRISLFINPAWLAGLARKKSSKMCDWCLSQKGFQRSTAKKISGQSSVEFLLFYGFNPQTHTIYGLYFFNRLQNNKEHYVLIHILYRFSLNNWPVSETEKRCNTIAFPFSSTCHNVCTAEQTFASIPSVCFHNIHSYIISHGSMVSMQIEMH